MRLGDLLIERGLISEKDRANAEELARGGEASLAATLLRMGAVSEDDLLGLLSEQVGLPVFDGEPPSLDVVRQTVAALGAPLSWLLQNDTLVWRDNGVLKAASPAMHDPAVQEGVEQWGAGQAQLFLAKSIAVEPVLIALAGESADGDGATSSSRLRDLAEEGPVVDFVNSVLTEAVGRGASDVHFEPFEDAMLVRMRIDGVLIRRRTAARELLGAVASRIKLLSGMNIAERRLPQDGRQSLRIAGRSIDVRVSSLPTTWGESIVVRLLGAALRIPELANLGLNAAQTKILLRSIALPHGLVLVSGPTGSGKTTTVYRLLSQLNDGVRKIVTIEDPVEFNLPGVLQMNVRSDINLDFAAGLRSVLRQDPDVIFVGEIRDAETARTAIQAALTGHLVISTLHTNSAVASIARLTDLGVEPFLLADVLRTVIGQRLVRNLCPACAVHESNAASERYAAALLPQQTLAVAALWRRSEGCRACAGAGYQGRTGVFEAVEINPTLQRAIRAGAAEEEIVALARREGFTSMLENGVTLARAGVTSLVEALRVLEGAGP